MTQRIAVFPADRHSLYEEHGYSAAIRSGDLLFVSGQVGYLLIEPLLPDLRYNHAPSNPYPGDFEWI